MCELSLREIQQEALKVLLRFDTICKQYGFKYFLIYGTLLGAVRHNGFIPWDDDLDVMMPREDFDRFNKYAKANEEALMPFKLCDRANTKNYVYGIPRFANTEFIYEVQSKYEKPFDLGTFIDIYPLDNFGNNYKEATLLWKHCNLLNRKFGWYVNPSSSRGAFVTFIKRLLHSYMRIFKGNEYEKYVDEDIRNYIMSHTSLENRYVGLVVWNWRVLLYDKTCVEELDTIGHVFEGYKFPIPKCYDYLLKLSYGDYMQLPPKEKRIPHHNYKIYRPRN